MYNALIDLGRFYNFPPREDQLKAYAEELCDFGLTVCAVEKGCKEIRRNAGDAFPNFRTVKEYCVKHRLALPDPNKKTPEQEKRERELETAKIKSLLEQYFSKATQEDFRRMFGKYAKSKFRGFMSPIVKKSMEETEITFETLTIWHRMYLHELKECGFSHKALFEKLRSNDEKPNKSKYLNLSNMPSNPSRI